ncbi:MAG: SUMF1/EgtB/PvdO family nonheme iron enzyme [Rubrivivax sp.]|nr:SUMF1/EgtB/PvdO family nonheme iron enzyme [Rubrivivax sp.]
MGGSAVAGADAATLVRRGGRDWLSLALLEARNELLARLAAAVAGAAKAGEAAHQGAGGAAGDAASDASCVIAAHACLAARAGWFHEWWIARHVQRARGEAADERSPRLPGIEPRADGWVRRAAAEDLDDIRAYLGQTLEQTLDLLGHADDDAQGLYFFRLALQHDDRIAERLGDALTPLLPPPRAQREPLGVPAQRWWLGSAAEAGAFVPHGEHWAHEVAVPEFEIDAQCVNWAQFAEFAEDGGYDRRDCWSDAGWAWLQRDGRRAPRDVEQLAGSVLVARGGQLQRAPSQQAAMHVTRHEAEAWCRWAGRRLPTEPEWELAAHALARRGFVWGDVLEWVAGSARPYPGAEARVPPGTLDRILPPGTLDRILPPGTPDRILPPGTPDHTLPAGTGERGVPADRPDGGTGGAAMGVLRGGTSATPARWRHAKARRFAPPHDDGQRNGFRSCAL